MKSTTTAVAKAAAPSLPAVSDEQLAAFLTDAGQGMEEATQEDYALPFLKLLQALSPQLKKTDAQYIPEAEQGDIFNSVTGEIFTGDDGLRVVPVHFNKRYLEYRKRDNGGGFVAAHDSKEDALANMQDGNEIVDTANHYVLYEGNDGAWRPAILSMTSSKLKVSRKWMSQIADVRITTPNGKVTPPSFAMAYRVTAVSDTNRRGEDYFNYKITPDGFVTADVYADAKRFREQLLAGELKTKYEDVETVEEVPAPAGAPTF